MGPTSKPAAGGARRRAAAVAGHTNDELAARALLGDADGEVRAAALGALARMGALRPEDLVGALRDPASRVRRRACDLAGRLRLATLAGELIAAVSHGTPEVTEAACYALGELAGAAEAAPAVAALAVTSRDHREPLCREAAVAALGALGIPEGLPAVLAALADKPAIRRRAVVALAAFEGDDVDAALVRAAQDPDWQVRQAAEDLLGDHPPPPGRDG